VPILSGDEWDSSLAVEGHQAKDGEDMQAFMNAVTPGYFAAMNIPLLEGRDFRDADARRESTVAIVNRRFAEHYFPGKSAVGKRLGWGGGPGSKLTIEIVGVVANALYEGPREGIHRQVFVPNWGKNSAAVYLRTLTPSATAYNMIRNEVKQLAPSMPVYELKTVEAQLDETLLTDRLIAMLSAGFGMLATLLATIGLYGVMAFVVARRRKELGIRLALGAQSDVGDLAGDARGAAPARHRPRDRRPRRACARPLRVVAAVRHPAQRPVDRDDDDDPARARVGRRGLIPAHRASRIDPILALRYE
jgi:hypothetical protein